MIIRLLRAAALLLCLGLAASVAVAGAKPALIWFEGEAATKHNFVPGPTPRAKCSGDSHLRLWADALPASGRFTARWRFRAPSAGTYRLWLGGTMAASVPHWQIDDGPARPQTATRFASGTYAKDVGWSSLGLAPLTAGDHTLTLTVTIARAAPPPFVLYVDALLLTTVDFVPEGNRPPSPAELSKLAAEAQAKHAIRRRVASLLRDAYHKLPRRNAFGEILLHAGGLGKAPRGPWSDTLVGGDEPIEAESKAFFEWCRGSGIEGVIQGGGWTALAHLIAFADYPEARVQPRERVVANQARARAALAQAKGAGIPVYYAFSWNWFVPKRLVARHPEIVKFIDDGRITRRYDRGAYWGDPSWSEPFFARYVLDSYGELLDTYPTLAGLLIGVGEPNNAPDDVADIDNVSRDFLARTLGVLQARGKRGLLRTWHFREFQTIHPEILDRRPVYWCISKQTHPERYVPKAYTCIMKYSQFDCVWADIDPVLTEWQKAGHRVYPHVRLFGENAASQRWCNPELAATVMARCRAAKAAGVVIDCDGGNVTNPIYHVNLLANAYYAASDHAYTDAPWAAYLDTIVPGRGAQLLAALKLTSDIPLHLPRVAGQFHEGFTLSWPYSFANEKRYLGVGGPDFDPPDWWQTDILGLWETREYLKQHGWSPDAIATAARDRTPVAEFWAEKVARANEGLAQLEALTAATTDPAARMLLDEVVRDQHTWVRFGRHWLAVVRAKVAHFAVRYAKEPAVRERHRDAAARHLAGATAELHAAASTARGRWATRIVRAWTAEAAFRDQLGAGDKGYARMPDGTLRVLVATLKLSGQMRIEGARIKLGTGVPAPPNATGEARYVFPFANGRYTVKVSYIDDPDDHGPGTAAIELLVNKQSIGTWTLDDDDNQTRVKAFPVTLKQGDTVVLRARADATGDEMCRITRLEFAPIPPSKQEPGR